MIKKFIRGALALMILALPGVGSAESVKIGFVTTLTTGAAVIGNDMRDAVNLAVEDLNGKMGGLDIEVIFADDGFKPETGKQVTDKLVKSDDVDFVAGYIWSHVLLASQKSVLNADKFLISANAGPSQLAGKLCHRDFFSTSWQNDQTPMAMGAVLSQRGVSKLYVMAPNYAAGKNMVAASRSLNAERNSNVRSRIQRRPPKPAFCRHFDLWQIALCLGLGCHRR